MVTPPYLTVANLFTHAVPAAIRPGHGRKSSSFLYNCQPESAHISNFHSSSSNMHSLLLRTFLLLISSFIRISRDENIMRSDHNVVSLGVMFLNNSNY